MRLSCRNKKLFIKYVLPVSLKKTNSLYSIHFFVCKMKEVFEYYFFLLLHIIFPSLKLVYYNSVFLFRFLPKNSVDARFNQQKMIIK